MMSNAYFLVSFRFFRLPTTGGPPIRVVEDSRKKRKKPKKCTAVARAKFLAASDYADYPAKSSKREISEDGESTRPQSSLRPTNNRHSTPRPLARRNRRTPNQRGAGTKVLTAGVRFDFVPASLLDPFCFRPIVANADPRMNDHFPPLKLGALAYRDRFKQSL